MNQFGFPFTNMMGNTATAAASTTAKTGLISRILGGGVNWGSLLTNTQRTLGVINQAIPVVKQISPLLNNAKTMFKVMSEFKKEDNSENNVNRMTNNTFDYQNQNVTNQNSNIKVEEVKNTNEGPIFFV